MLCACVFVRYGQSVFGTNHDRLHKVLNTHNISYLTKQNITINKGASRSFLSTTTNSELSKNISVTCFWYIQKN